MNRAEKMAPEQRQQHLLQVAIQIFAEKGLDSAKHGHVATAAKVSVPTVHAYFKTRSDLVNAVLNEVGRYLREECTKPYISQGSYEQRMHHSGIGLVEQVKRKPDYFKVWIMWGASFGEPYRSIYEQYLKKQTPLLSQVLTGNTEEKKDKILYEKARLLEGMSMLLAQLVLRGDEHITTENYVASVSQMLKS